MTRIRGSYDDIPSSAKIKVTGSIPANIHRLLFDEHFTRRGVQDKIVTRLLFVVERFVQRAELEDLDNDKKEDKLNEFLNHLADYAETY